MLGLARCVVEQGHGFFHGAVGALCQQGSQVQHAVVHGEFGLVKPNGELVAVDRFGAADGAALLVVAPQLQLHFVVQQRVNGQAARNGAVTKVA